MTSSSHHPAALRPIGGFFGLSIPSSRAGSYLDLWHVPGRHIAYTNARSAFRALIDWLPTGNIWLPAYICNDMAEAVPRSKVRFYPVGQGLVPDLDRVGAEMHAHDVVVAVDYFGRAQPHSFRQFVTSRPDLIFVQDCAQSPRPAEQPWADWRLFSARKVVGVPDGGFIVPASPRAVAMSAYPSPTPRPIRDVLATVAPALSRFEDERESDNTVWYGLSQRRESAETNSNHAISLLSWSLLGALEVAPDALRRRVNFAVLADKLRTLEPLSAFDPSCVPFGFPIQVAAAVRPRMLEQLFQKRIYPAVHWSSLPSPLSEFREEHELAQRMLTLPCDQRYDESDMERLADAVLATGI